jgi:hypothetical protein
MQNSRRQPASFYPQLEALEGRWLFSTLTVTTIKVSGAGSLRAQIAAAGSGDTIVFSPTLNGKTIALANGELALTRNLTIQGPGGGQLTISGKAPATRGNAPPPSRVFEVAQNTTVTLRGLTISNGNGVASAKSVAPWDGFGGGILNHGTMIISGCTVYSNSAQKGGGIYSDATLTASGCTISGNAACEGGGIFNAGDMALSGSKFSINYAFSGGGIYNHGTAALSGCTLSGNVAERVVGCTTIPQDSGGIFNDGELTVKNSSSIKENSYSLGFADVVNAGVLYLDGTSTIGVLDGNAAVLI